MIPPAVVRALTNPALIADTLTPTKWSSAEDKAKFGSALLKFIAADFPKTAFKKPLYNRLSNTFGHIAHYDLNGFYTEFFEDTAGKIEFLQQTLQWPCWGDPAYTYCDVERLIQARLRKSGILAIKQAELAAESRRHELTALERLKDKYEPTPALSLAPPAPPMPPAQLLRQTDLFDVCTR
jgi:hypothetical protein